MKKYLSVLMAMVLLLGMAVPNFAATTTTKPAVSIDKMHLSFLNTYAAAYSAGDVPKFKALLESPKLFIESTTEDFATIKAFNENTGLFKFYIGDEVKLLKQNTKLGTYTYGFDMYTLTTTDTDVILQKMPVKLSIKKVGKALKITNETVSESTQIDDLTLIPTGVLKKMDADHKALYEVTLTEAIDQATATE